MNDSIKWLLAGVGIYLLYEQYAAAPAAIMTGTSKTTATNLLPAPVPTPQPTALQSIAQSNLAVLQQVGTAQKVQAAASAGSPGQQLNQYQWTWYFTRATGLPDPNLSAYNLGSSPIPFATYWTAVLGWANAAAQSPTGVSGLGHFSKPAMKSPLIATTFDMNAVGW